MGKHGKNKNNHSNEADVLAVAQPEVEEEIEETSAVAEAPETEPEAPETEPEAPETAEPETTDTETTETPAPEPEAPKPALSIADLVASALEGRDDLSEEEKAKFLEDAQKASEGPKREAAAKAMLDFNKAVATELPPFIEKIRERFGVNLSGKTIRIAFPKDGDGAPTVTGGKGSSGSTGTRDGFPARWGKAEVIGVDGSTTTYDSPKKAAEALGLQVEGQRTMLTVFTEPRKAGTKDLLPKLYTVDAEKGDHFRITVHAEPVA